MDAERLERSGGHPARPGMPAGIVVVTIDRLPAWMLPAYGATWVATPALDGLAARGVVFDRVITPGTDPGVADPASPGAVRSLLAAEEGRSLVAEAAARGWSAVAVTDDPDVPDAASREAFAGGAGDIRLVAARRTAQVAEDDRETNVAALVDAALEELATGGRRLVWVHVGSLGVAWDAPRDYRDRYVDPEDPPPPEGAAVPSFAVTADTDPDLVVGVRQAFAGQLTLLDAQLARLFAAVRRRETADGGGWAVLVAGVRGLPLGLHGWVGTGGDAPPFGELVHVPAILVDASGRMAAQRYGGLVTPADLGGTLADLVGGRISAPPQAAEPWRAASLAGLFDAWSASVRDRVVVPGRAAAAVVTAAWHCVASAEGETGQRRIRLYVKPDDFFEQVDVADRCPEVAESLGGVAGMACDGDLRRAWLAPVPPSSVG